MNRIRQLRESRGMQQKDLSVDLKVSQPTISDWESGRKTPSAKSVAKLADYFSVSIDYLLGRDTDFQSPPKKTDYLLENEKKPAPSVDGSELSENEIEMLRRFRDLSETQQDAVLEILKRS